MRTKYLLAGIAASTLLATAALAQSSPPPAPAPAATATKTAPVQVSGQWRASKLIGLNVYNNNNEKIGDINEILVTSDGKISGVVIGAGGFLGMGEHDVLVKLDQIKFVNEPVRTSAPTTTTTPHDNHAARARADHGQRQRNGSGPSGTRRQRKVVS